MASNWLAGGGLPFVRPYTSVDPFPPATRNSGSYGDQAVRFSENGRLIYPGQQQQPQQPQQQQLPTGRDRPTNLLLWRNGTSAPSADGPIPTSGYPNLNYRPWSRTIAMPSVVDSPTAPIITRRVESVHEPRLGSYFADDLPYALGRPAGLPAKTGRLPSTSKTTTMTPETIVIEEMRIYDQSPCGWPLFLVVGLLMLAVGFTQIAICFDNHWFGTLWTGAAVLVFALVTGLHKGDYFDRKSKNWLLILSGYLTSVLIFVALFKLTQSFCHQVIEVAQFNPTEYTVIQLYRYSVSGARPLVALSTDWVTNIWSCLALDAFYLVLLLVSLGVLTTTSYVVDRFFNSHYQINRKVEPFCEPWLFNPWGQVSLGQAMVVVGCVIGSSEYGVGTNTTSWFVQYAVVWVGIIPIVSGPIAALELKTCGDPNRDKRLSWLAIGLEVLSLVASVVAVILVSLNLADNVSTLNNGAVMLITSFSLNLILASAVLEALTIIIAIVNIFYSMSLAIRILACLYTKWYHTDGSNDQTNILYEGDEPQDDQEQVKVTVPDQRNRVQGPSYQNSPDFGYGIPRFDPFRPLGPRSFYMR